MVGCQDQIIFSSKSFQEIINLGLGLCISRFVDFPRFGRLPEANHVLIKKSHQPSGLRWFRFKTLPIFQLGGFTLPPTPFPGLWFQGFAGRNRINFGCSFRAPFFSRLGNPQNRYHKLFRRQNGPDLESKRGPKQALISELTFSFISVDFVMFSIPPQVPPVKRLPYPNHIFACLAFFSFSCLFGSCFEDFANIKCVPKRTPKRNPKLEPSKRRSGSEKRSHFPKRGSEMVPQKGRRCGVLFSFLLCCNFLLDFGAFRAYFER